ncbi:MAG TPA: ribonuclease H-like domain-containing protein [Methanospirillum sp.]|uniref:ribonuclease H-like domain-containing protein n=1 Tax=Methanospirillum sp. TaxID=45200 RepID=UPI002CB32B30|nr:ribonuclease H-like domain-containing protein [Methanospirillum sp.]HOJ97381.1 ribonuclease H-like domain-containing protein [Methanospirillum sp.]HPP76749.1 ribonuclease H-like domain-containing protein [Methanospirillum sp.]
MAGADLAGIGRRWQEKIAASPEYTIVPHDNVFRLGLNRFPVRESVFIEKQRLLSRLCTNYSDVYLEDCFPGEERTNQEGEYYVIDSRFSAPCIRYGRKDIHALFNHDLTLVRGVGPSVSARLKSKGCKTLHDMARMRKYRPSALRVLEVLEQEPVDICRLSTVRKGSSHPLTLLTSCLFSPESFRFVDIETLGIFGRPVILIGLGFFREGELQVKQYLLRNISEEAPALYAFMEEIPEDAVFVSFNGRSFDIPYIADRLAYYGLPSLPAAPHYDLLHPSRRLWKHAVPDCRLGTLETRILGITRDEDLPGALVPEWYCTYMETKNPGPLIPIVDHNRQDVVTLAFLLERLVCEWYERLCVS